MAQGAILYRGIPPNILQTPAAPVAGKTQIGAGTSGIADSSLTAAVVNSSAGTLGTATAGTDYTALAFKTIAVSGQSDIVADSAADTLTIAAGANVTLTTNAGTDTLTIAATGGGGGSGTVTNTGTLIANKAIIGNGGVDVTVSAASGVAHLSSGTLTGSNVDLTSEVTGDLPFANLAQIAGLSVLGVTGSATADVAAITAATDAFVLTRVSSSSLAFAGNPGAELDYVEFTTSVNITATTEGTANTIVTGSSVAYNGSTVVMIEFYSEAARPDNGAAGRNILYYLFEDSTSLGIIASQVTPAASTASQPIRPARRHTPSNASHTYSIRASVNAGTGVVAAGAGGSGTAMPGYIRITRK